MSRKQVTRYYKADITFLGRTSPIVVSFQSSSGSGSDSDSIAAESKVWQVATSLYGISWSSEHALSIKNIKRTTKQFVEKQATIPIKPYATAWFID